MPIMHMDEAKDRLRLQLSILPGLKKIARKEIVTLNTNYRPFDPSMKLRELPVLKER
ncbi:MAG TPA: hypothetical protein VGA95_13480 [Thermodesulfobacteriota bacterium]